MILTRLLAPEVFGLMAIVNVVLIGVRLFSDIGLNGGVIRSKSGDDEAFLNTAWSMQVIRGIVLWVFISGVAYPASLLYNEPKLIPLLLVIALTALTDGFWSTSLLTLRRAVNLKPQIVRELVVQITSLIAMVILAWVTRSIWALVAGAIVRSVLLTITSYFLPMLHRPRFVLNRDAIKELLNFGCWIFISTALTFVFRQGDRLALGKAFSMEALGIYTIGALWAMSVLDVVQSLSRQVLFPVYAAVVNTEPNALRTRVYQARSRLLWIFLPPLCVLVVFGDLFIRILYSEPYHEAGPILQILAMGSIAGVIVATSASVLLALGDSFRFMLLQAIRGGGLVAGMYFGYQYSGFPGMVSGMTISHFVTYPALQWAVRPYRVGLPKQDGIAFGLCAVICLVGLYLTGYWPHLSNMK